MRNARLVSMVTAAVVVLTLVIGSATAVGAAQGNGRDLCVAVSGGTVLHEPVLDLAADGGTGIADTSGGSGNAAVAAESGNDNGRNNNNGNGNNGNGNGNNNNGNNNIGNGNGNGNNGRNDWASESVSSLAARLLQNDTASSGNGGVATASGNGGVVSVEDINSGGNVGNAIAIGDTVCPGAAHSASGGGNPGGRSAGGNMGGGARGGQVRALPSTGVGMAGDGASGSLVLALGALSMMVLAVGSQRQRRVARAGVR